MLDSCEHVIEAVSRLAETIYQQAPGVSLLATSRESLDAEGKSVFELASLGIPRGIFESEAELVRYSSTRLFMECAVAAGYASTVTDADAEVVARICRKLDGMPLAIELVASRLAAHGLVEIDELIEGRLRLAWRGRRTAPPRHQSLSAALDWSYELIAPEERTLLEYLSIFPGAFTLQGARALAGHLDDPDAVLIRLEQLVTKSLVASRPRSAQTSFRLLETTRAYATEKFGASGASHVAAFRHASYVLGALKPRSYEPGGERPGGWTHRADLLSDARAALAWVYSDAESLARKSLSRLYARGCSWSAICWRNVASGRGVRSPNWRMHPASKPRKWSYFGRSDMRPCLRSATATNARSRSGVV